MRPAVFFMLYVFIDFLRSQILVDFLRSKLGVSGNIRLPAPVAGSGIALSVLLETCRIKWKSKRPTDRLLYFLPPGWVTLSCQRQITDNVPKHKITFCFLLHGGTAAANGFGGVNGCKIRVLFHKRSRFIDLNRCPDTAHRLSGRVSPTHPAAEIPTARYSCPSRFRGIILRL